MYCQSYIGIEIVRLKFPHANSTFAIYFLLLQFLLLFIFNICQIKFCFENSIVSPTTEISALSRISALSYSTCADIHNECTTLRCDQRCARCDIASPANVLRGKAFHKLLEISQKVSRNFSESCSKVAFCNETVALKVAKKRLFCCCSLQNCKKNGKLRAQNTKKVAQNENRWSKYEKLPKSCRATCEKPLLEAGVTNPKNVCGRG